MARRRARGQGPRAEDAHLSALGPRPSALSVPVTPVPLSLYIHIPWCVRKCPYCDFNSHVPREPVDQMGYVEALLDDLDHEIARQPLPQVGSIFIGGGTPSLFSPPALARLLADLPFPVVARSAQRRGHDPAVEADAVEAAQWIAWGRGEDVAGLRDRHGWILGDIVHATPVVVGGPTIFRPERPYHDFYLANQNRQKMVYIAANDGMLHVFDEDSGREYFSYIPRLVYRKCEEAAENS